MTRYVLMGVSGSGKSSTGEALAKVMDGVYIEGDQLHPPNNVAKMARGEPLEDVDRWPWLDRVASALAEAEGYTFVGCSALKRLYRDRIRAGAGRPVRFFHLTGPRELIAERMARRQGHYMPLTLLDSQFAALEPPGPDEDALSVDVVRPLDSVVADLIEAIAGSTRDA